MLEATIVYILWIALKILIGVICIAVVGFAVDKIIDNWPWSPAWRVRFEDWALIAMIVFAAGAVGHTIVSWFG